MNCSCGEKAICKHIYGVYEIAGKKRDIPMNELATCDKCGAELWEKIKASVQAKHMHYEIRPLIGD